MRQYIIHIVLIIILTGNNLLAQENPDVFSMSLEELAKYKVVTASQKNQALNEAPANIFVILGSELIERGYSSLFDLVVDLPAMTWTSTIGYVNNGTPVIRGIRDVKRFKLMINGMTIDPKNGNGTGWTSRFPIEGIERVEYIIGPYASLYGRNTFSGVLNIVTKNTEKIDGGILNLVYGKHSHYQGTLIYSKNINKHEFYISFFKNYSIDGIDMTKEYPEYYNINNREGKIFQGKPVEFKDDISKDFILPWDHSEIYFKYQNDFGLALDLFYNCSEYPKVGNALSPLYYTSPKEAKVKDQIFNFRILYNKNFSEIIKTNTSLIYQNYDWSGRNYYISGTKKWYAQKSNSFQIEEKIHYKVNDWNELYLGVSFETVQENPFKFTFEDIFPTWAEDELRTNKYLNITFQEEITILNKMHFVAGLMYETSNVYSDVLVPRLSFLWQINNFSTLKLLYGGGYLTPDPIVGIDQIIDIGSTKGTTDISPEFVNSFDINFIHRFSDKAIINLSLYLMGIKDMIAQVEDVHLPDPYLYTWKNLGKTLSRGIDISFKWKINKYVKLFSSVSYVDGNYDKYNSDGSSSRIDNLPVSSQYHSKIGINFLILKRKINLYIHNLLIGNRYTYRENIEDAYQIPAPDFKLDSYNLVDVNLSTTKEFDEDWRFSISVKNIFDKKGFDVLHIDATVTNYPPIRRRYWTIQVSHSF